MARAARQSGADPEDEDYEEFEEMLEQAEGAQVRVSHMYTSIIRTIVMVISRSYTWAHKYKEYIARRFKKHYPAQMYFSFDLTCQKVTPLTCGVSFFTSFSSRISKVHKNSIYVKGKKSLN